MQRGRLILIMGIILALVTILVPTVLVMGVGVTLVNDTVIENENITIQPLNNRGDYKMIDTEEGVVCYRIGSGGTCFNKD